MTAGVWRRADGSGIRAEDDAHQDAHLAAATPPARSGPGRATWPLAAAAIVVCATVSAIADAVRAVRT